MLGTGRTDRHRVWVAGAALAAFAAAVVPWFVKAEQSSPLYRSTGTVVPTAASTVERIHGRSLLSEPLMASLVRIAQLAQTDPTARVARRAGTLVVEVSADGPTAAAAEASAHAAMQDAVSSFRAAAGPAGDIDFRLFPAASAVRVTPDGAGLWSHLAFAALAAVLAAAVTQRARFGGSTSTEAAPVEVPSIAEFAAVVVALAWRQGLHRVLLEVDDAPGIADALSTALVRRGLTITPDEGPDALRVVALHRGRAPAERTRLARDLNADAVLVAG